MTFDSFLLGALVAAISAWLALSCYVLLVQHRREAARATIASVLAALKMPSVAVLPVAERVGAIRGLLDGASRELVMAAATNAKTPPDAVDALAAYLIDRWGSDVLEHDARPHRSRRGKWRRMKALQILTRRGQPVPLQFLADAVHGDDSDVAAVALSLLGSSEHPAAAELLIAALQQRRHPASRVAAELDRSPLHLAERLRPLLHDADPVTRLWAATLLGRYPEADGLERDLVVTAEDSDPRVRKAAVQSLGQIGDAFAAVVALRLLNDPVPFVRAAAARALSKLGRDDLAEEIASLLGDRDWWVRFAAKECLESLGPEIWPVLVRLLEDPDRFVRNGAAEVFQNLGVLDSFIVMEAATDDPAAAKIDLLRRIALAGGLRLTDSLIERAGASLGPRVRHLLVTIGLEHVGAV